MSIKEKIDKLLYPSPDAHKSGQFGYKPNTFVTFLRSIAKLIITIFRLNSNNRLIVEIQQMLDPAINVRLPSGENLVFCTGHGRLVWRAKTLLTEEEEIIKWIDSFSKGDIFYDIGANVGSYSLYAAKTKDIRVYAFEPEINNVQLLYSNVYKNGLSQQCIPLPLACDRETKIKPFYIREFTKGGAINSIGRKSIFLENDKDMFIQDTLCMRVDDAVRLLNIPLPTKVKIDVDTNELNVIEGMDKTLDQIKEIYIELYAHFEEHKKVINILEQKGFFIFNASKSKAPKKFEDTSNYIFKRG
jgi:FkbM family methyltransferase